MSYIICRDDVVIDDVTLDKFIERHVHAAL